METFQKDDAGYRSWLGANLGGFVVNAQDGANPGEPILHRATCDTITPTPRPRVDQRLHQRLLDQPIRARLMGTLARAAADAVRVTRSVTGNGHEEKRDVPRLALSVGEAAEALSVSLDFFNEHIRHELRVVRRGRKILISVRELERWLEENSARTLGDGWR